MTVDEAALRLVIARRELARAREDGRDRDAASYAIAVNLLTVFAEEEPLAG